MTERDKHEREVERAGAEHDRREARSRYAETGPTRVPNKPESYVAFNRWWDQEGSELLPEDNEDRREDVVQRISKTAWLNGAYLASIDSARYEYLRQLNPQQFRQLFSENITTGVPFDTLVDREIERRA